LLPFFWQHIVLHTLIEKFLTAHRSIAEIPLQRDSLRSFKAQRTLSLNFFFLSADPGGIGSAFHWAEEGRKEKTTSLREIFVISIDWCLYL
jgi:hypothetical protein